MSSGRSNSVATVDEYPADERQDLSKKAARAWELSFLTPKLRFIKTQYGQRFVVNAGGFFVTVLCLACFIYFFITAYVAKAVTQYLSNVDSSTNEGRTIITECSQVAKVVSEQFGLGSKGVWSTNKDYYTQQSVFTFTASEMQVKNEQFAQYMNVFDTDLEVFRDTYLKARPWSENLKRMMGYRWSTVNEDLRAEFDIDFNSILNPTSYGAYFSSGCGVDFSDSDPASYLNLDSGVYSYDRRIYAYSEMDSDAEDDYMHFQWNFEVQDDAHSAKTAFDGEYYISTTPTLPFFGTDSASWETSEGTVEEVDMDGTDSAAFRLTSAACPAGFNGRYSSGELTCKLAINKNLAVLAAALNEQSFFGGDAYMDESVELINVTDHRFISRKFATGDYIVKIDNIFNLVSKDFLFAPLFNHWSGVCDELNGDDGSCSSYKDSCYTNDFEINLIPIGVSYDIESDDNGSYPFAYSAPDIDCKLFAPFYLGPQSDSSINTCSYDDSMGCGFDYFGDGWCDDINNNACCGYDGGDCCESTCIAGEYNCGSNGFACCQTDEACESSCPFRQGDSLCPAVTFDDDYFYYYDDIFNFTRRTSSESSGKAKKTMRLSALANLGRNTRENMEKASDIIAIKEFESLPAAVKAQVSLATKKHRNAGLYEHSNKPENNQSPGLHKQPRIKTTLSNYHTGKGPKISDNHRMLVDIPMYYNISDIPSSSGTNHYMELHQPITDAAHKYGYIKATSSNTDFMDSYMCYSKALVSQSGLCQSLCNGQYGSGFTEVDQDGFYGGFLASALTFSLDADLGQILVDAGASTMGFIMAKKIHFIDYMINGEVKIAGQVAVTNGIDTTLLENEEIGARYGSIPLTQVDAENGSSYLPCEPAACYCYERFRPLFNSTFFLNTKTDRNFLNSKYYELGGLKAHCNDPYKNLVIPTSSPVPLIESFYECESTTQSDVGTVFGSTFANVGKIQQAAMIIFIMFLTNVWFKCCVGKEMEDVTRDDDDFEMETRRLVTEAARARKLHGGNIGEAMVETLQRTGEKEFTASMEGGSEEVEMSLAKRNVSKTTL